MTIFFLLLIGLLFLVGVIIIFHSISGVDSFPKLCYLVTMRILYCYTFLLSIGLSVFIGFDI